MDATKPTLPDHYAALELSPSAGEGEVRAAWRRLSRTSHPDVGGDAATFAEISAAYHVLSSPTRRAAYDAARHPAPDSDGPAPLRPVGETDKLVREYLAEREAQRRAREDAELPAAHPAARTRLSRLLRR